MSHSVLVVDDSEIVLSATRSMLEEGGYRVSTHRRATGSVALILQTKPDLVLLDVNMPHLRGDMVAKMSLATNHSTKTIVVLHSTLSEQELAKLQQECGAHGYIRKTNDTHLFLRLVKNYLGDARRTSVRAENARPAVSAKAPRSESVLLIDQDVTALSALSKQVQDLGYTPTFALSYKQAAQKIELNPPDVLIINNKLGDTAPFLGSLPRHIQQRCALVLGGEDPVPKEHSGSILYRPVFSHTLRDAINEVLSRPKSGTANTDDAL